MSVDEVVSRLLVIRGCEAAGWNSQASEPEGLGGVDAEGSKHEYARLITAYSHTVMVKWTAEWCGPCKRIEPKYQELYKAHKKCVVFAE
eukprot:1317693-Amorphochlora_amoeboformis.AAC.2